ncbi:MAG: 2-oxo acid dehydrogenase subunit E2 [candidate division NC10 bacterium]|nr:2-oxo acid dehydrogenase subunit E2 [candidate division NC10 bacterium]
MATRIDMPQLGLTMETGTVLRWLKSEGETVEKGQPVVLIQTDKVEYEVESPAAGTLLRAVAPAGAEMPVGRLMGILGQPGEDVSALLGEPSRAQGTEPRAQGTGQSAPSAEHRAPSAESEAPSAERRAPSAGRREWRVESREAGRAQGTEHKAEGTEAKAGFPPEAGGQEPITPAPERAPGRIKISPVAKKLAQEHGIDIASLPGTGPEGRIVREDVEREMALKRQAPSAKRQAPSAEVPETIPLSGIRKVIFDRMAQSWREVVRVTMFVEADVSEMVRLRRANAGEWERRFGLKPSYSDLIHMAVARALREEPRINCRLEGQAIRVRKEVNLAFAVDLGEGLVAVVIRDADRKSLGELARAARDLAERARAGRLAPADMADGTFTVTNLGGYGIEGFTPIVNSPQAGILGVGKIQEKPVVIGGGIHVRSMATLSLVFDHRLIDGAPAAKFLAKVKESLERPTWAG